MRGKDGTILEIDAKVDDSVALLLERIKEKYGISPKDIKLIYNNEPLVLANTLSDYYFNQMTIDIVFGGMTQEDAIEEEVPTQMRNKQEEKDEHQNTNFDYKSPKDENPKSLSGGRNSRSIAKIEKEQIKVSLSSI